MRSRIVAFAAFASLPACFALFSLEGYGPQDGADATTDATSDGVAEGAADSGPARRVVFLTSNLHEGSSFKSAANADAICAQLAASAQLPGKFHAWISDSAGSPATRIPALAGVFGSFDAGRDAALADPGAPLQLLDGKLVATDYFDLIRTGPRTAIAVTEKNTTIAGPGSTPSCDQDGGIVWTHTTRLGTLKSAAPCDDWTDTNEIARGGVVASSDPQAWTDGCAKACGSSGRLICFQE